MTIIHCKEYKDKHKDKHKDKGKQKSLILIHYQEDKDKHKNKDRDKKSNTYHYQEDKDATICPELSGDKRAAGNSAFQKKKDEQVVQIGPLFLFWFYLKGILKKDILLFFFLQGILKSLK